MSGGGGESGDDKATLRQAMVRQSFARYVEAYDKYAEIAMVALIPVLSKPEELAEVAWLVADRMMAERQKRLLPPVEEK